MTDVYRTPDERFADLPEFPFEPRYRETDGLRLAHVEDGDGPPVVFFHGEPTCMGWYSYERHVELMRGLVEGLDLRDATVVVHDWGGPIGLRLAVEHPDRISRLVILDTGLFTGRQHMSR